MEFASVSKTCPTKKAEANQPREALVQWTPWLSRLGREERVGSPLLGEDEEEDEHGRDDEESGDDKEEEVPQRDDEESGDDKEEEVPQRHHPSRLPICLR